MHITILYYIIYAHIKFAFDSFISKNTRERERERQREDKQTFIIWSRIVYWELPFYNIHCHSLFVFFSQTVYMYVCQKVRVYYLFSNPLSIIVHQFAFCAVIPNGDPPFPQNGEWEWFVSYWEWCMGLKNGMDTRFQVQKSLNLSFGQDFKCGVKK